MPTKASCFLYLFQITLAESSEKCVDVKMSKERLAIMLCSSFTDEKLKSLMIRKSKKQECFKNVKIESSLVHYKSYRKAWIAFTIFAQ